MTERRDSWEPPQEFGEYRLVRLLGRGAMGQVYLADDLLLGRPVAVKFIAPKDGREPDEAQRERLVQEARAIARLQHPNVVTVFRVGSVRGRPYLVSEFVRGQTLAHLEKPVPVAQVLSIGLQLARGLAAAHRSGVLHRDVKPANAVLTDGGEAKLLDFGVAKFTDRHEPMERSNAQAPGQASAADTIDLPGSAPESAGALAPPLTREGALVGSPLYMAPEVWRGQPATRQSDVYSLGVLLFELAAGTAPHAGVPLAQLGQAVTGTDAPSLAQFGVTDHRLRAIVERCLEREPSRRLASADALREALEAVLMPPTAGVPAPGAEPYRGLLPFSNEDQAFFRGREADTRAVVERLAAEPFVLVAGDSGVGKSSLCAAGVLPWLERHGVSEERRPFLVLRVVPGRRPVAALASALAPVLQQSEAELSASLRTEPMWLGRALRRVRPQGGTVVYVDQLEELVTLGAAEEASVVGRALASLSTFTPGVRLLATARGDCLGRLAAVPGLGEDLQKALFLLRPLGAQELREAIVGPATALGVRFESERLVDELLASADSGGGLALLQFTLAELWRAREVSSGVMTENALAALGGVRGALAKHADQVLEPLLPEARDAARDLLLRLVTPEGTRARASAEDFGTEGPRGQALETLLRGRLVVAHAPLGTEASARHGYEIAHEALLTGWDTLRGWLSHDAERRAARQRLARAAAEWERLGRLKEALWSGRRLQEVQAADDLEPREQRFVEASRRVERRRFIARWVAVAVLPLVFLGGWAGLRIQAQRRLLAQVGRHVAAAEASLGQAHDREAEAEQRRRQAFALFDDRQLEPAEVNWASARTLSSLADDAYGQAAQQLEAAVLLDAERVEVRQRVAQLLFDRAALAERWFHLGQSKELIARLPRYDDGRLASRWNAPTVVGFSSLEPGLTVRLRRFDGPPKRALLEERVLGLTPLAPVALTPGSYLFSLEAAHRAQVLIPIAAGRGERVELSATAPPTVPEGMVFVAAGSAPFGTADDEPVRRALASQPLHLVKTKAYFIGRTEVTFGQWIEFLEALPLVERRRRGPMAPGRQVALDETSNGGWRLTLKVPGAVLVAAEGEPLLLPGRSRRQALSWKSLPVVGVSWDDALAYEAWLDRSGRVPGARPCTEYEWERAARGADGRLYPHGDELHFDDASFDETYGRALQAYGPDEVGAHPASASPFGVLDLSGNVWEATRSVTADGAITLRGGSWYQDQFSARVDMRDFGEPSQRSERLGVRVCADAQ